MSKGCTENQVGFLAHELLEPRPKGKQIHLHLPLEVADVVNTLGSGERTKCQCPNLRSTVKDTLAFESYGGISSSTGD